MGEAKKGSANEIRFIATVARVQTMADGGLRFTFDVPETAIMQAAQLMECKRFGAVLSIVCLPDVRDESGASGKKYFDAFETELAE